MDSQASPTNTPASREAPTHVLSLLHRRQDSTGTPAQPCEGPESGSTGVPHGYPGTCLTGASWTPRAWFHGGPMDIPGPAPRTPRLHGSPTDTPGWASQGPPAHPGPGSTGTPAPRTPGPVPVHLGRPAPARLTRLP